MARVTLVVNSADEGSETFLHTLAGQLDSVLGESESDGSSSGRLGEVAQGIGSVFGKQ